MAIKKSLGERIFNVTNVIIMLLLMIVTIYPIFYVTMASLSSSSDLARHTGLLLHPLGFNLQAYSMVFANRMIMIGYKNTIVYVVVGTAINITLTTMGAYGLSRRNLFAH